MSVRRPVFFVCVLAVCGAAAGLPETGSRARLLFCAGSFAALFFISISKRTDRWKLLLPAAAAIIFASFYLRAARIAELYGSQGCKAFFDSYSPDNEGEFDYALYLKGEGICTEEVRKARSEGNSMALSESPLVRGLYGVRCSLSDVLTQCFREKDAGIYKAVILGEKTEMDEETKDLYQSAGISHLLSISGLHISMIGTSVLKILQKTRLRKKAALAAASLFSLLYVLMTGSSGSSLRACVMLLFQFAAAGLGVNYDGPTALAVAAALILFLRPYAIFESSFQFSFGAAFGICVFSELLVQGIEETKERQYRYQRHWEMVRLKTHPPEAVSEVCQSPAKTVGGKNGKQMRGEWGMEAIPEDLFSCRYIKKKNRLGKTARTLTVSLGVQLITLPVLLYHYFRYPVYSALINLAVIPLMSLVMYSGCAALLLGLVPVLRAVAPAAGASGHYILKLYEMICSFVNTLPLSSVCPGRPAFARICLYYLFLSVSLYAVFYCRSLRGKKPARPVHRMALFLMLSAAAVFILCFKPASGNRLRICCISCGQGDSFLVEKGGSAVLFDGGSSSERSFGERTLVPVLESRGIGHVDKIFISHPDNDHTSGVLYLLEESRITAEALYLPAAAKSNAAYDRLRKAFTEKPGNGSVYYLHSGSRISLEKPDRKKENGAVSGAEAVALCLFEGKEEEDVNRHSPVMLLTFGDFSMLFTGDIQNEEEELLCRQLKAGKWTDRPVTVYKAAHHGSKTSNSEELLSCFRPCYAVISCGKNNKYGHPHSEVLKRLEELGAEVFNTVETGEICFETDGSILRIRTFKQRITE